MLRPLLTAAILSMPVSALAQVATNCFWDAYAPLASEPITTYANGAIRVAVVDRGGASDGSKYLLIGHPQGTGPTDCTLIGFEITRGFASMWPSDPPSRYDPAHGLTLIMDAIFVLPDQNFSNSMRLFVTINQATGGVTLDSKLGRE